MINSVRRWGLVFLIVLGLAEAVGAVVPQPVHWWLTPIGIWALFDPLLRFLETGRLPLAGPPHWVRRLGLWLGRELGRQWRMLAVLGILSYIPYIRVWEFNRAVSILVADWVILLPAALAHLAINLAVVFLVRTYGLSKGGVLVVLGGVGVAGRVLVDLGWASRWSGMPALEIAWIATKAIVFVWLAVLLDQRQRRGLRPPRFHEFLADLAAIPWIAEAALEGPLKRISRANLRAWWFPPALTLLTVVVLCFDAGISQRVVEEFTVAGSGLVCAVSLVLLAREAARSLGALRRSGFLSSLLLTELRPREIVAARSAACLRPFRRVLGFHFSALALLHLVSVSLWSSRPWVFFTLLYFGVGTLALGHLVLGPYLNLSMRSRGALEAWLKITGRFLGLEAIVVGVMVYVGIQGTRPGGFVSVGVAVLAHSLILLWVFSHWQRLLGDFEYLAHGNEPRTVRRATRDEVEAFRRSLEMVQPDLPFRPDGEP